MLVAALEMLVGIVAAVGVFQAASLAARGYKKKQRELIAKRLDKGQEDGSPTPVAIQCGDTLVATGRSRWFIDEVGTNEGPRWVWRCVDAEGRLWAASGVGFKAFLGAYADAKKNGMDAHDFVPGVSQHNQKPPS